MYQVSVFSAILVSGDDAMVEEVKNRLKNAGFDLTKYSL